MTERNEHDERANRRVFEPAIARLREELASLERQASATRALIEALVVRAGATDPMRARIASAKTPPRELHRSSRATSNAQKRTPAPTTRQVPTNTAAAAVGEDGAKELAEIVAAVVRGRRDAIFHARDLPRLGRGHAKRRRNRRQRDLARRRGYRSGAADRTGAQC